MVHMLHQHLFRCASESRGAATASAIAEESLCPVFLYQTRQLSKQNDATNATKPIDGHAMIHRMDT
jgi:hypothetical protein